MDVEKEEFIAGATAAVGSAGATVVGVTGVGAAGTAGAAAITSGLAAVGGIVGGGMATGLVITAAAPIAIGTGVFFAAKGIKKAIRGY